MKRKKRKKWPPRRATTTATTPATTSKKWWTPATTTEPARFPLSGDPKRPLPAERAARVALGLGGNLGDPLSWFRTAARVFSRHLHSLVAAPLYRSDPVSRIAQPAYLNTVLAGFTTAPPEDLLAIAKALERAAGRDAAPARDQPRPLDVDLLVYGDEVRTAAGLSLPHPRLRERRFALQPLVDLDPAWRLPPDGQTASEVLAELAPTPGVECLGSWR